MNSPRYGLLDISLEYTVMIGMVCQSKNRICKSRISSFKERRYDLRFFA